MLVADWPKKYEHFTPAEMRCPCCGVLPDPQFMDWLQIIRRIYGAPLPISSGARCAAYNAKVSETGSDGPHTTGLAADVLISGPAAMKLIGIVMLWGIKGMGLKQHGPHDQRFMHLDIVPRDHSTVWTYRRKR